MVRAGSACGSFSTGFVVYMPSAAACAQFIASDDFQSRHDGQPVDFIAYGDVTQRGQCFACTAEQARHSIDRHGWDVFDMAAFVSAGRVKPPRASGATVLPDAQRRLGEVAYTCLQSALDAHCYHGVREGTVARRAGPDGRWVCSAGVDGRSIQPECVTPAGRPARCPAALRGTAFNATVDAQLAELLARGCHPGRAVRAPDAAAQPDDSARSLSSRLWEARVGVGTVGALLGVVGVALLHRRRLSPEQPGGVRMV